jgi:quercetin dioxygenase-like cupin family protein
MLGFIARHTRGEEMTTENTTVAVGTRFRFLDSLMTVRADSARTGGQLGVTECWAERGHCSPTMIHSHEDDGYFVIEGELTVWIHDDPPIVYGPGGFAWVPRGTTQAYAVSSPSAHFLCINTPGGFERFFATMGAPADGDGLPQGGSPAADEVRYVGDHAPAMGITITGPPPGL